MLLWMYKWKILGDIMDCNNNDYFKVINKLHDDIALTYEEIGSYIGLTRQSVSKICDSEYLRFSANHKKKLDLINGENNEIIKTKYELHKQFEEMFNLFSKYKRENIEYLIDIIKYIKYWPTTEKFGEDYMKYLLIHMNNFHMKLNPYHLLMRRIFHKEYRPVISFNIDYNKNIIKEFAIDSFDSIDESSAPLRYDFNYREKWSKKYKTENIDFNEFVDNLVDFYEGKLRYSIYLDEIDNEFDYIYNNLNKEHKKIFKQIKYFDLARLFRHEDKYIKVEELVENFKTKFEEVKLLSNPNYRNKHIIEVVGKVAGLSQESNYVSVEDVVESFLDDYDKNVILQDSNNRNKAIIEVIKMISGTNYSKDDKLLKYATKIMDEKYRDRNKRNTVEVYNRRNKKMGISSSK